MSNEKRIVMDCPPERHHHSTLAGYCGDVGIFKEFKVREGHTLQFRYEAFNFLNKPQFGAPDRTLGDAAFGRITTTVMNNREMQFGLKYRF